jgi:hypothetical protein
MDEPNTVHGGKAGFAHGAGPADRDAPRAEIGQSEPASDIGPGETIAGDGIDFTAKRETQLTRDPAIGIQERRRRNPDPLEDVGRRNRTAQQIRRDMQQRPRVVPKTLLQHS